MYNILFNLIQTIQFNFCMTYLGYLWRLGLQSVRMEPAWILIIVSIQINIYEEMKKSNSMMSILNELNANFETYLVDNKIKTR